MAPHLESDLNEEAEAPDIAYDPLHEKTKVVFRKGDHGMIIALLPEVLGDIYDADLCLSFRYMDTATFFS